MLLALGRTLAQCMPAEFMGPEYDDAPARKYADVSVLEVHYVEPWPGKERHVHFWVEIGRDLFVGWNENPSRGWTFPVYRRR